MIRANAYRGKGGEVASTGRRFVFVINSLMPGGAERSLVELLPHLSQYQISPILVCLFRNDSGFEDEVRARGFDILFLSGRTILSKAWGLRQILRSVDAELVNTVLFEADIVGRLAAIGTGIPVLTTLANVTYDPQRIDSDPHLNRISVAIVRILDAVTARHLTTQFHAVSQTVKASAVKALGLKDEDVTVVYRGRDPERLGIRTDERTKAVRAKLGLDSDSELILTVGRQEFQKGHIHLIEAYRRIVDTRPGAVLAIAGRPGAMSPQLKAKVEELGLVDKVLFLGHRDDVPDLLAAADVFVFPSLWEGLGGALIEALALEAPIVASDLEAVREVLGGESHGILVPPGDEAAIASAVIRVLEDPNRARNLTEGSRRRYERCFTSHVSTERFSSLMMQMVGD